MHTNLMRVGASALATGALVLGGAAAANAATFTTGHTDIVSVSCSASGALTVETHREDVEHISRATIGNHTFTYDASASGGAFSYNANTWTASGNEAYEDNIPFIGFQYASAGSSSLCPASVSFDVSKVTSGTNTGNAVFTANDAVAGSTSSAANNTSKVTVWRPGTANKPSHEHGTWTFGGPSTGGDYTLQFDTYRNTGTTSIATTSPVHIHVQP